MACLLILFTKSAAASYAFYNVASMSAVQYAITFYPDTAPGL